MFASEFDGRLFQFEAREPEFAALSQFPPKIAARLKRNTPTNLCASRCCADTRRLEA